MTSVTDAESRFLENVPTEISEVLDWYRDGQSRAPASQVLLHFAGKFLGALYEDGAVVPETLSASAPEILALLLLQHRGVLKAPARGSIWVSRSAAWLFTELKTLSTLIDSVCNLRCRLLTVRCN